MVHQRRRWTYATLNDDAEEWALGLLSPGVRPGDRVGIWGPNRFEWAVLHYATAKIGAILVSISPAYRAGELEYVLRQSGTRMLISAQQHKSSDYRARLLGDAWVLARPRDDRYGDRCCRLDAHRHPGADGRGRLRRGHRPHQGHDHRGWGEYLPKEIEDLLDQQPDNVSAQVVGVPHERYGE